MNRFSGSWPWLFLALITLSRATPVPNRPHSCISYKEMDNSLNDDDTDSDNSGELQEQQIESTPMPTEPYRRTCSETFCFTLWNQTANGTKIVKQGCWADHGDRHSLCSQSECNSSAPTSTSSTLYFCCCFGDVCNDQYSVVEPSPLELGSTKPITNRATAKQQQSFMVSTMLGFIGGFTAIMIGVFLAVQYCRVPKEKSEPEESPLAPSGPGYSSNLRNVDNMNLIGMLGSGKYGTVMKGLLHDEEVAVKIYPEEHHQYYVNERNIYALPLMDCPALLSYFGYDERCTMDGRMEYQLVLSLAPLGCLQDWLIANTLTFSQCGGMLRSITRGISHLHTELRLGDQHKPCVAHRDINTRNILVQADLSCCIADFGFALKVFGSKYEYKGEVAMAETKSINEVGTLRYMAPELLEGAVNLRDCETSLKQMDVYALGLVLWEVATRCSEFYAPGQATPPYKAPYEQEVGSHPSFDQMQALVVRHKARPLFPAGWGGGSAAKVVRDTCEDCWDHDADARLTSLCAEERMQEMSGLRPRAQPQPASPMLNTNNLVTPVNSEQPVNVITTTAAAVHHQMNSDTAGLLQPPPNQQLPPAALEREKNHLSYPQQQLQPYQGRNPCQERNLAPMTMRTPPVLVERSKKHSFQTQPQENSLSCLEHDVSVEELIASHHQQQQKNSIIGGVGNPNPNLGQGFPKQQNTDHKLRGWHGVRALIHKKLFRKEHAEELCRQLQMGEEKSNLVTALRRPNNLDLSPRLDKPTPLQLRSAEQRSGTPAHIVPRSLSSSLIKHINGSTNNNSIQSHGSELQTLSRPGPKRRPGHLRTNSLMATTVHQGPPTEQQMRRQHSLEVFREVFSGRGSSERLRDPSERVKTPGDVPPSVRKARASKTLSLYDDRMMDSSLLNIL
ncbi:hypothetical protein KR026_005955 [Drosophila bipectinata]|nr:hypothetical protein KR026_005955 [Drosophila bipectinata]